MPSEDKIPSDGPVTVHVTNERKELLIPAYMYIIVATLALTGLVICVFLFLHLAIGKGFVLPQIHLTLLFYTVLKI